MHVRSLASLPLLHVHASPACNLKCGYCTQIDVLTDRVTDDFLQDPELWDFVTRIPPTHIYVSGGEPLLHPGLKEFVALAGKHGHKVTLDTNLVINLRKLNDLLDYWDKEWIGYINISHHVLSNVPLDNVLQRVRLLRQAKIRHYVKYLGAPETFPEIERNMNVLLERGIGAVVTLLYGPWGNRVFPAGYTLDETVRLLGLMTLNAHALQVFGGIFSRGRPCRSGQDAVIWNMKGRRELNPCCHSMSVDLDMNATFFATGNRERVPCPVDQCVAYTYFIYGINGVMYECDRLDRILNGNSEFLGLDAIIAAIRGLIAKGHRIVYLDRFLEVERYAHMVGAGVTPAAAIDTIVRHEQPPEGTGVADAGHDRDRRAGRPESAALPGWPPFRSAIRRLRGIRSAQ